MSDSRVVPLRSTSRDISATRASAPPIEPLLTVPEVARLLKVSRSTAYEMAAAGLIPVVRVGVLRKAIRVPQRALDQWILDNTAAILN